MTNLIAGYATEKATQAYMKKHADRIKNSRYSDFPENHLKLSSLGIGTFGGAIDESVDDEICRIVMQAMLSGINVFDTGTHYRYGRSLMALGAGLRAAMKKGVQREEVFLVSKGGFLTFPDGMPEDFNQWFENEIVDKQLGSRDDLVNNIHLLSPEYITYQIELSRQLMGVETLDAFLVDQPEVHIPVIGKEKLNQKLLKVFTILEQAVRDNKIRNYGISTFHGVRVETDNALFQSITSMQGLAEKAAKTVSQKDNVPHHFKIIQLPFNMVMTEGFARFNQATGQGNVSSSLQAAYQLGVYAMASHVMMKGHLAQQTLEEVKAKMPGLKNPAQFALQFACSTPGIGTALVGISQQAHFEDLLSVARQTPMLKQMYLSLYQKA